MYFIKGRLSMAKPFTTEEFIKRSKIIHGDKYDYSKAIYVNQATKVIITCPIHGDFEQHPANHYLKGTNCPKCGTEAMVAKQKKTLEQFIAEASSLHDSFYTYEKVIYKSARKPVTITCPEHGDFEQLPTNHLKGVGCPSCHGGTYNASKPTLLYYLKINDGEAYKIGITCKTINTRFSPQDLNKIEVIKYWEFKDGLSAYKAEQAILKRFSSFKYEGSPLLISGNTELFYKDILETPDEIQDIIERQGTFS